MNPIDDIDITILDLLQTNGRIKRNDLAEAVGLSLPAASERLRKLEESGMVMGYHARLNHRKLGKDITAFVLVTVDSSKHFGSFVDHVQHADEIQECHAVTGDGTHIVKVRTDTTASLERILAKIQSWGGVVKTSTSVVLSSPKESTRIKLNVK